MKPSDVESRPIPFPGTFQRTEIEMAMWTCWRGCLHAGDAWQPVTVAMINHAFATDLAKWRSADGVVDSETIPPDEHARFWCTLKMMSAMGTPPAYSEACDWGFLEAPNGYGPDPLVITDLGLARFRIWTNGRTHPPIKGELGTDEDFVLMKRRAELSKMMRDHRLVPIHDDD